MASLTFRGINGASPRPARELASSAMNGIQRFGVMTAMAVAGAGGVHVFTQESTSGFADCAVPALQARAPKGTVITGAATIAADGKLPKYCQVDGHVATPGNEVNFRLGLPERWNGKYYFVGVGGLGGSIGPLNKGLERGYASASTDTGHVSSDETWMANRAKEIDYGHRGTHVTAVAGKELAGSFYGQNVQHAYFDGCSNGGRQALMEVQRYPTDFDGIIAGDPATGTPMQVGRALVYQRMLSAPEHYLTADKLELLSRATLAACDKADGLEDGLVTDPRLCTFKPETLKCAGADGPDCLTAGQLAVVKQIYDGAKLPNGEVYSYGFPAGHEGGASGWRAWISGPEEPTRQADGTLAYTGRRLPSGYGLSDSNMRYLALDTDDPSFNWRVFKFPDDLARMKTMSEILSPLDADLRPYKSRGGRLLMYHGWSDPAISAYGTVDYYDKVSKIVGGQQEMDAFAKLYLVPGMHHCSGGPGPNQFDMLTVLENWVEQGVSPGPVTATHSTDGRVDRSRPLCPYPQIARYVGTGSVDDAANFRCDVAPRR
jgi:feruloyl esterase